MSLGADTPGGSPEGIGGDESGIGSSGRGEGGFGGLGIGNPSSYTANSTSTTGTSTADTADFSDPASMAGYFGGYNTVDFSSESSLYSSKALRDALKRGDEESVKNQMTSALGSLGLDPEEVNKMVTDYTNLDEEKKPGVVDAIGKRAMAEDLSKKSLSDIYSSWKAAKTYNVQDDMPVASALTEKFGMNVLGLSTDLITDQLLGVLGPKVAKAVKNATRTAANREYAGKATGTGDTSPLDSYYDKKEGENNAASSGIYDILSEFIANNRSDMTGGKTNG